MNELEAILHELIDHVPGLIGNKAAELKQRVTELVNPRPAEAPAAAPVNSAAAPAAVPAVPSDGPAQG